MERLSRTGLFKILVFAAVCLIGLLLGNPLLAQSTKFFRVSTGEVPMKVLPIEAQYRFVDFRLGKVMFHNNKTATAKVNYNMLYREMQFINRQQDTLTIAEKPTVKKIVVNDIVFHYHPKYGYLEELADYATLKLASSRKLQEIRNEDLGSNSSVEGTYESNTPGSLNQLPQRVEFGVTEREFYNQPARQPLTLVLLEDYYFQDFNQRWHPAQKSNIRKVFRSHQKEVTQFISEENINFTNVQDLTKLLWFCSELE